MRRLPLLILAHVAWVALLALLFASVGLFTRATGVAPLHFAALSSVASVSFIYLGSTTSLFAASAIATLVLIGFVNTIGLIARSTAWLRRNPGAQLATLFAVGALLTQLLSAIAGVRFYAVGGDMAQSMDEADRIVILGAVVAVTALLVFDLRWMRIRLVAIEDDRARARLAGVPVKTIGAAAIFVSGAGLATYSLGATLLRGHQINIDTLNVILAAACATAWKTDRVATFAAAGCGFGALRLCAGLVAGAQWQETACLGAGFLILVLASLLFQSKGQERGRADGIHNPLGDAL